MGTQMRRNWKFSNNWQECERTLESRMATFYRLDCKTPRFVELSEGNDWEGIVCPINEGHQRAGCRITQLHIDIVSRRIADFSTTILPYVVITDHALQVLTSAKLTGFRVEPVVVHNYPKGMDQNTAPKLWEFVVTGDGGFAAAASEIKVKEHCNYCGLTRYTAYDHGIKVDENTYDGSDFFIIKEYPTHILVNMKAKSVIECSNLSGCTFIESTKLRWPEGVVKP